METQLHLPYGRLCQLSFAASESQEGRCNQQPNTSLRYQFVASSPSKALWKSAAKVRPRDSGCIQSGRVQAASLACSGNAAKRKGGSLHYSKKQTEGTSRQFLKEYAGTGSESNHPDCENDGIPSSGVSGIELDTGPESSGNKVAAATGDDPANTLQTNRGIDRHLRTSTSFFSCSEKVSRDETLSDSHTGDPPEKSCATPSASEILKPSGMSEPSSAQALQLKFNPTHVVTTPPLSRQPSQPPLDGSPNQHAATTLLPTSGGPVLSPSHGFVTQHSRPAAPKHLAVPTRGDPSQNPSRKSAAQHSKLAVPKHLAVIMDGNSRWAKARGLPTAFGHEQGVDSLLNLVKMCVRWGVVALTVYAFSTENWLRPKGEVDMLMGLFERVLQQNLAALERENICLRVVGEIHRLPPSLQRAVAEAHERTAENTALLFTVGISYSGRQDLVQACQALARTASEGGLDPAEITEASISARLGMATESSCWRGEPVGDPDLLLRTSGEQRLSNFLLWQLAYTELYFTDALWPDFGEADFEKALEHFSRRERRFGGRR